MVLVVVLEVVLGGSVVILEVLIDSRVVLWYWVVLSGSRGGGSRPGMDKLGNLLTFSLKWISTNLPKRLLLLLRTVLAFPKASSRGLAEWGRGMRKKGHTRTSETSETSGTSQHLPVRDQQ